MTRLAPKQIDLSKHLAMENSSRLFLTRGSATEPSLSFNDYSSAGIYLDESQKIALLNGTASLKVSTSGIEASTHIIAPKGDANAPSYSFLNAPTTGAFLDSNNRYAISVNGGVNLTLDAQGLLTLGGYRGLVLGKGTTLERPSTDDATLRYNTELNAFEGASEGFWHEFTFKDDNLLHTINEIVVKKNPGQNQYSSIKAAVDSITDANSSNLYVISVGPGIYIEDTITLKPYVVIRGTNHVSTVIQINGANKHLIIGDDFAGVADVTLTGVSGSGYAALYLSSKTNTSTTAFFIDSVKFGNNDTHALCYQPNNTGGTINAQNCTFGSNGQFNTGFVAKGDTTGQARLVLRNFGTAGMTSPLPQDVFVGDGPLATILISNTVVRTVGTPWGNGVRLRNGATSRFIGVSLRGFAKGIYCENAGIGPHLAAVGINLEANTHDLYIDHPNTNGFFNGSASRLNSYVDPNAQMSILYMDPVTPGVVTLGGFYTGTSHANLCDILPLAENGSPMGVINGGEISKGLGLNLNITGGYGYLMTGAFPDHRLVKIDWDDTSIALPANSSVYVYYNSSNILSYSSTIPSLTGNVILGRVVTDNSKILYIVESPNSAHHPSNKLDEMVRSTIGALYDTGSIVSPNASNPLSLDVSSGIYYFASNKFAPSGGTAINFTEFYHNSGSWTTQQTNVINTLYYDNGTNLQQLTSGYYVKHSLYLVGDGPAETYMLVYGQEEYATLVEAESGNIPTPPSHFGDSVALLATLIVQKNASSIAQITDARPIFGFRAPTMSVSSVHGNLIGLDADDHLQYLRVDGARSLSGDLNLGGNKILSVNTINGINITTHGSRHAPNGADPLPTGSAVSLTNNSLNSEGIENKFSRSDHTHNITGFQTENSLLTSLTTMSGNGLMIKTSSSTSTSRAISGVTNQTSVTNGDGQAGNPTIGLASNPIIPGNTGIGLPTGSTAQRVNSQDGTLRFNNTTGMPEYSYQSNWYSMGGFKRTAINTSTYNALLSDYYLGVNVQTNVTIMLPVGVENKNFIIKDESGYASVNTITIQPSTNQTIDGKSSITIAVNYGSINLVFGGTEWHIF